jgi:hypothetical protein
MGYRMHRGHSRARSAARTRTRTRLRAHTCVRIVRARTSQGLAARAARFAVLRRVTSEGPRQPRDIARLRFDVKSVTGDTVPSILYRCIVVLETIMIERSFMSVESTND